MAVAARALDDRKPADLVGNRGSAARLRLLAEGVSRRGRQAAAALRRDAPFHPGDRQRTGCRHRRDRRRPSGAKTWALQLWDLAVGPRDPRSADGEVPPQLLDAPGT